MKNLPIKIYLQVDDDGERPEDFDGLVGVSWCADKINDSDVEYILSSYAKSKRNKTIDEAIDIVTDYQDYNPLIIERLKAMKV